MPSDRQNACSVDAVVAPRQGEQSGALDPLSSRAHLRHEAFGGTFPFFPRYASVHYVDEGLGETVLFLHGDPTWGYLWRKLIPPISRTHRCIAPDHMGMGKSSVPRESYPYRLRHHIQNLEDFVLGLDLRGITLVLHDWGGPVGLGVAVRHPERIKRPVLMNTWAFALWPGAPLPKLLEIIRSPRGEKFVLDRNGYVEPALRGLMPRPEGLNGEVLRAYLAPFPTPETRLALVSWTRDITLTEGDPSYPEMRFIELGVPQFDVPSRIAGLGHAGSSAHASGASALAEGIAPCGDAFD